MVSNLLTSLEIVKSICLTFADKKLVGLGLAPGLLLEAGAADLAVVTACVVLTATQQLVRVLGIRDVACVGVTIAATSASNTDVFDRIEILPEQNWS